MSRWRKLVVLLTFTGICGLLVKQYIATASLQAATTLQSLQARQAQLLGTSRGARDSIDVKRLQAEVKELKEQLSLAVGTPTTVREHSHEMSYAGHASIEAAVDAGVDVRLVSEGTLLRQDTSIPVHEASEVTFTYESCVAKISEGKGRPALPLRKKVHWLHIPKRFILCWILLKILQSMERCKLFPFQDSQLISFCFLSYLTKSFLLKVGPLLGSPSIQWFVKKPHRHGFHQ